MTVWSVEGNDIGFWCAQCRSSLSLPFFDFLRKGVALGVAWVVMSSIRLRIFLRECWVLRGCNLCIVYDYYTWLKLDPTCRGSCP